PTGQEIDRACPAMGLIMMRGPAAPPLPSRATFTALSSGSLLAIASVPLSGPLPVGVSRTERVFSAPADTVNGGVAAKTANCGLLLVRAVTVSLALPTLRTL